MRAVIDVSSRSENELERALSNFTAREFVLDGIQCGSIEGALQSFKFQRAEEQAAVCKLAGYPAYRRGQEGNDWKRLQLLWWLGVPIHRSSQDYQDLLDHLYDAAFDQCGELRDALRRTVGSGLRHTRGKHDTRDTVLTEAEYVRQLYRLRWRVLDERVPAS